MKGLFVKDMKLLLGGGNNAIVLLALIVLEAISTGTDGSIPVGWSVMLMTSVVAGTKCYDFYENGMSYLLTLPVSRREYVRESYLIAVSGAVLMALIAGALDVTVMGLKGAKAGSYISFLNDMQQSFGIVLWLIALLIPFYIQFGVKKSSYVALIMFLIVAVGVTAVLFFALDEGVTLAIMLQRGMKMLIKLPVSLTAFAVSYVLSIIVMEKKDF